MLKEISTNIKNHNLIEQRRSQITKAALRLFAKNGYHKTSIRQISKESGVNIGSLYDYVKSKEDVLILIYKELLQHRDEAESRLSEEALKIESLDEFVRFLIKKSWELQKDEILVLYRESFALEKDVLKEILAIESNFIREVAKELKKRSGLDDEADARIEMVANILVFLRAFQPLRGWNTRAFDPEFQLDIVVEMIGRLLESVPNRTKNKESQHDKFPS